MSVSNACDQAVSQDTRPEQPKIRSFIVYISLCVVPFPVCVSDSFICCVLMNCAWSVKPITSWHCNHILQFILSHGCLSLVPCRLILLMFVNKFFCHFHHRNNASSTRRNVMTLPTENEARLGLVPRISWKKSRSSGMQERPQSKMQL